MQFSSAIIAASVLAVANAAKFTMTPYFFQNVVAGTPLNLTWSLDGSGPVAIYLKNGPSTNLKTVAAAPALSGVTGTSVSYTIPVTLPDDMYAFEIDETGEPVNYSEEFALTGGASSSSSSSSSSLASSTSTVTGSSTSTVSSSSTIATTSGNSTSASKTSSSTSASKTGSSTTTSSTTTPSGLNSASGLASPLALVFLAVAAVMTLQ